MSPSQVFSRRGAASPDPWPLLLICLLPVLPLLLTGLLGLSANPLPLTSGLSIHLKGGVLPGYPWIDPNSGTTTQALGRLSASDWLNGGIPWWNHFAGVGLPLAAEFQPAALFLPFVLLLHFDGGVVLLRLALQITSGLFTYALMRQMQIDRFAACLGAVLYEFNGTFAWFADAPIQPLPFLPLLLLGLERARVAADARGSGGWAFISIALAGSLYAGFPETAFLDGLLGFFWAAYRFAVTDASLRWRYAAKVLVAGIAGLLLAAPQLLPGLEYLALAQPGLHDGYGTRGLPPSSSLLFLLPYAFGPIAAFGSGDPTGELNEIWGNVGGYLGTTVLFLALLGLDARRQPRGLRWLLAAWVVVCVGRTLLIPGITQLLNLIPALNQVAVFRYGEGSWEFACILLASFALDRWRRDGAEGRQRVVFAGGLVVALTASAIVPAIPLISKLAANVPKFPLCLAASLVVAMATLAGVGIMLTLRRSVRRSIALGSLILAESLGLLLVPLLSGKRAATLDLRAVAFLQQHLGLQRVYSMGPLAANYGAYFRVATLDAAMMPVSAEWSRYILTELDPGAWPPNFIGNWPGTPEDRAAALRSHLNAFSASSVRYILVHTGFDPFADTAMSNTAASGNRAYPLGASESFAGSWSPDHPDGVVTDLAVMIGTWSGLSDGRLGVELCAAAGCASGTADLTGAADNRSLRVALAPVLRVTAGETLHWRLSHLGGNQGVVVWLYPAVTPGTAPQPRLTLFYRTSRELPRQVFADSAATIYELPNSKAYYTVEGSCVLRRQTLEGLHASCDTSGLLTRRELFYPGWHALVNGREAPLERALPIFQAVNLPAGEADVRFVYWPRYIVAAYAAALLGLLAITRPIWGRFGIRCARALARFDRRKSGLGKR